MKKADNLIKNAVIIILAIVLSLVLLPKMIVAYFYISWSTTHRIVTYCVSVLLITIYAYIWANVIVYVRKGWIMKKKPQLLFACIFIILGVTIGGHYAYDAYQDNNKVSTEVDLYDYQPYKSDKLVTLDEPSKLTLEKPLPRLDGATAFYPVYAAMTQTIYPKDTYEPYGDIVRCSTTPVAYDTLLNKDSDLIFVFAPSKEQQKHVDEADEKMLMTPIGKESFVFFVHKDNPVDHLTSQQIRDIYSGKITNWKEVGGNDESIRAFQRPEGSGSQTILLEMMGNRKVMAPIEEDVVSGMGGIISQTADYHNSENAIGYSFRFFTNEMVNNSEIKLLKIDGVSPDKKHIRDGSYPFIYPFYAITLESNRNDKVNLIISWLKGEQGKELIEKSGYVAY